MSSYSNLFNSVPTNASQEDLARLAKSIESGNIPEDLVGPEEKKFLIVFTTIERDDDDEPCMPSTISLLEYIYGEAVFVTGRHNVMMKIKSMIFNDANDIIDFDNSKVYVNGLPFENGVPLRSFIPYLNSQYPNDAFDIDMDRNYSGEKDSSLVGRTSFIPYPTDDDMDINYGGEKDQSVIATGTGSSFGGTLLNEEEE